MSLLLPNVKTRATTTVNTHQQEQPLTASRKARTLTAASMRTGSSGSGRQEGGLALLALGIAAATATHAAQVCRTAQSQPPAATPTLPSALTSNGSHHTLQQCREGGALALAISKLNVCVVPRQPAGLGAAGRVWAEVRAENKT